MADTELRPCPFCGGEAYYDACDRLIQIGCKPCGYSSHWRGLLTTKETAVKAPNSGEYYNRFASEQAITAWNTRQTMVVAK